jgi:hypothetical protein
VVTVVEAGAIAGEPRQVDIPALRHSLRALRASLEALDVPRRRGNGVDLPPVTVLVALDQYPLLADHRIGREVVDALEGVIHHRQEFGEAIVAG